ncbi:MAG: hypothetical protein E6H08_22080 [Bacteroidetes bacterium]|nr:MAG: hypothetical protein E6H08_22080 [Bacteroidota bacterium]
MKSRLLFFITISSFLFLSSCSGRSNEIGGSSDVNPETIWFDYQISGEEGSNDMAVMLQFRFAGKNGTTLVLDGGSKVEFDGIAIKADSSKMTGAFYEVMKPVNEFAGKHSIVFTDINGKQYKEEFNFTPISLKTKIPDSLARQDLVFELDGLDHTDFVRVLLTDTAFTSEGINRVDTVKNGRVIISKEDLETVVNGPVQLELIKEYEKPVKNGTREGGHISINYGLKRSFKLNSLNPSKGGFPDAP